jgi:hypothetical protein
MGVGDWLAEQFTLFAATFQNWMIVALIIILAAGLIAWWRQR